MGNTEILFTLFEFLLFLQNSPYKEIIICKSRIRILFKGVINLDPTIFLSLIFDFQCKDVFFSSRVSFFGLGYF